MSKQEADKLADTLELLNECYPFTAIEDAIAKLRQWPDGKPVAYQYLFEGTYGPVWRNDDGLWNGQKPTASRPLYTAPPDQSARTIDSFRRGKVPYLTWTDFGAEIQSASLVSFQKDVNQLLEKQSARIAELEAENFALAAGQCAEVVGDEGGTPRCKRISELERQLDVLLEALKMAVRRTKHESMMTGEDVRLCESAIKAAGGGK